MTTASAQLHSFQAYALEAPLAIAKLESHLSAPSSVDPQAALSRKLPGGGTIFLFNFGAIAFWDTSQKDQEAELTKLLSSLSPTAPSYTDEYTVALKPGKPEVGFHQLSIDQLSQERAEVIASTLAQSAAMELYETQLEAAWSKISSMVEPLATSGKLPLTTTKLHRKIGEALRMRNTVVRVLHLLDRPDLIWEDPIMDEIYVDLRATFDLPERFQALEYKLKLIQETLEILVDVVRDRRFYWLEFAIVALILFDICLSLGEKFLGW